MAPKINLELYKNDILTWLEDSVLYNKILSKISDI
jgi:hypothetical protein